MELKAFFLFLFTLYLISCVNSASIYNDELLSKDEYGSHVLSRLRRSTNRWTIGEGKKLTEEQKNANEEEDGLRHENIIYITLADNSEKSKESFEDKYSFPSFWSILGKTSEFFLPSFVKELIPKSLPNDFIMGTRSKFDPPPFNPNAVGSRGYDFMPI